MTVRNGADNAADRATGQHWEQQFCRMACAVGKVLTPHQIGREQSAMFYGPITGALPDITIWSAPGEHHEIKHKRPTYDGMYGLERYRLDALVRFANTTGQPVYYTIHDWSVAGADNAHQATPNDISHWFIADVARLATGCTRPGSACTYYNGELIEREAWYWTANRWFRPLAQLWQLEVPA